jgi:hypothetical protein
MPLQRDYLLRFIEELARAVAAILGKRRAAPADALTELERARDRLFGPLARGLDKVAPESQAKMLGEPEKVRAYATLLALEAQLRDDLGQKKRAVRQRILALDLFFLGVEPGMTISPEERAAMTSIRDAVDPSLQLTEVRERLVALSKS